MNRTSTTTTAVTRGDHALRTLEHHAAAIDASTHAFCQQAAWLLRAARLLPGEPLVVTVEDDGALTGLIAASVHRRGRVTRIEPLGGDLNDYAPMFATSHGAAAQVAEEFVGWVRTQRRWLVDIVQIDHPILATELVTRLGTSAVEGAPMPRIVQLADFAPTKSARKANRKTANRLDADGRTWHFDRFDTDVPVGLIDSLVTLRRARDHASGRRSHLDDPRRLDFFLETIDDRLSHGLATIHTLTIDDELAAYVIGLRDQNVHRVWDGRVAVGFERYRAGIACTWRMREDAQADPSVDTLDWLRGINPEKIHNDVVTLPCVRATSHRSVDRMDGWSASARAGLKSLLPSRLRAYVIGRA